MNVYQCPSDHESKIRGHLPHNIGNAKRNNSILKGKAISDIYLNSYPHVLLRLLTLNSDPVFPFHSQPVVDKKLQRI